MQLQEIVTKIRLLLNLGSNVQFEVNIWRFNTDFKWISLAKALADKVSFKR